ncbi:MAG TPA: GspH/FimT family pseudopilin [Methylomirabilota bacterium]|nr:GspH/FimT family pseudopilin [Methylomirabilota bacterium]
MRRPVSPGFTLIELVIVLFVLALGATVVVPAVGRGVDSVRGRAEVAGVAAFLRAAREQAVTRGEPHEVRLDPAARALLLVSGGARTVRSTRQLSPGFEITPDVPGGTAVAFYPQGLSSGGSFSIRAPGARPYIVSVDPLTGRVSSRLAGP